MLVAGLFAPSLAKALDCRLIGPDRVPPAGSTVPSNAQFVVVARATDVAVEIAAVGDGGSRLAPIETRQVTRNGESVVIADPVVDLAPGFHELVLREQGRVVSVEPFEVAPDTDLTPPELPWGAMSATQRRAAEQGVNGPMVFVTFTPAPVPLSPGYLRIDVDGVFDQVLPMTVMKVPLGHWYCSTSIADVTPGTTHTLRVTPVDLAGNEGPSREFVITMPP